MSLTFQISMLLFLMVTAMFLIGMNCFLYFRQRRRKIRRQIEREVFEPSRTNADRPY